MQILSPSSCVATFTRTFLKGNLKGIAYEDTMRFVSPMSANRWRDGILANSKKSVLDYAISNFKIS